MALRSALSRWSKLTSPSHKALIEIRKPNEEVVSGGDDRQTIRRFFFRASDESVSLYRPARNNQHFSHSYDLVLGSFAPEWPKVGSNRYRSSQWVARHTAHFGPLIIIIIAPEPMMLQRTILPPFRRSDPDQLFNCRSRRSLSNLTLGRRGSSSCDFRGPKRSAVTWCLIDRKGQFRPWLWTVLSHHRDMDQCAWNNASCSCLCGLDSGIDVCLGGYSIKEWFVWDHPFKELRKARVGRRQETEHMCKKCEWRELHDNVWVK